MKIHIIQNITETGLYPGLSIGCHGSFGLGEFLVHQTKSLGENSPGRPFLLRRIGPTLGVLVWVSRHSLLLLSTTTNVKLS